MIWVSLILESSGYDNNLWLVRLFAYYMIALREYIVNIILLQSYLIILEILILGIEYVTCENK
jgi:hypothetical protein